MKLSSLIATLSCTGVMVVFSLSANAEMQFNGQNKNEEATVNELAVSRNQYLKQQSNLAPKNLRRQKSVGYSVFSFAKDKQITLDNVEQEPALENVEWYIEKY